VVFRSAMACLGAVSHFLGRLAWVGGRRTLAHEHLADATVQNANTGMVGWAARSKLALAEVLLAEHTSDARTAATTLLADVANLAGRAGMVPVVDEVAHLRRNFGMSLSAS
jgi:hypothetical protein